SLASFLGRPALVLLVDAGGLGLVVAWFMVAASFLVLRKREPKMVRPFFLKFGKPIGWAAVIMSIGVGILYMPGMPSALIWPYEWIIIVVWAILGVIFYKISFTKESIKETEKHMKREIDRVIRHDDN